MATYLVFSILRIVYTSRKVSKFFNLSNKSNWFQQGKQTGTRFEYISTSLVLGNLYSCVFISLFFFSFFQIILLAENRSTQFRLHVVVCFLFQIPIFPIFNSVQLCLMRFQYFFFYSSSRLHDQPWQRDSVTFFFHIFSPFEMFNASTFFFPFCWPKMLCHVMCAHMSKCVRTLNK